MAASVPPFQIRVYDKTKHLVGYIGNPTSVKANPRHNEMSTAEIVIDGSHDLAADLVPGARVVMDFRGEYLMSGAIASVTGEGNVKSSQLTLNIEDDFRVLSRVLAWINPTLPLSDQAGTTSDTYRSIQGPAETVVKQVVRENALVRLSGLVQVAPDLARGSQVILQWRMQPILDQLFPMVDQAGVGIQVRQVDAQLVLDVYTPRTFPITLTDTGGIVETWQFGMNGPTATRAVTGDSGQDADRLFYQQINADLEAEYGDIYEVFKDPQNGDTVAGILADLASYIEDGKPQNTLTMTLSETETFGYGGDGVRVGDLVKVSLSTGFTTTDVLQEAELDWTRSDGLRVSMTVGDKPVDAFAVLGKAIRALIQRQRRNG